MRRADGGLHRAARGAARSLRIRRGTRGLLSRRAASEAGFEVHVVDDRAAFASRERFPFAASVVVEDIPTWLDQTTLPVSAYAVIVTRGHRNDLDALEHLAPASFAIWD